jgi:two-component system response regulator
MARPVLLASQPFPASEETVNDPKAMIILMIDDNVGDIGLFRQVVDDRRDVVLHSLPNATQALAFLAKKFPFTQAPDPDLVFLDLRMPMISGHSIIPVIKGHPQRLHTRVVVFTSSTLEGDRSRCRDLGADDYIVKPKDWNEWKEVINRVIAENALRTSELFVNKRRFDPN